MAQEIEAGITDIKKGGTDNDIQAGLQFALAVTQIPQALNTCKGMGDDLAAIESWASIFKDPAKLAKKLALHYAMHKSEIKADIGTLETDWDSAKYFKAGDELAVIATLAIGPIETEMEEEVMEWLDAFKDYTCSNFNLTTVEIADFLAGFVYGFTGDNYQTYFESCFQDTQAFEADICTIVADFASKDNRRMVEGLGLLKSDFAELNTYLAGCPNAAADIATTESWAKYWGNASTMKLYSTAYKNLRNNMSKLNKKYFCGQCNFTSCTKRGLSKHNQKANHESASNNSIQESSDIESNHGEPNRDKSVTKSVVTIKRKRKK